MARYRTLGFAQDARLLVARARELERRGAVREAVVAYDMALAVVDGAPAGAFHADLLRAKGALLYEVGETAKAEPLHRRSLEVSQCVRYTLGVSRAQHALGLVHQRRGAVAEARQLYGDASLNAVVAGDQCVYALVELHFGTLSAMLGDVDDARVRYHTSLRTFRATGDEEGMSWVLYHIGRLHTRGGELADAEQAFTQAFALAEARGDVLLEGALELGRGALLVASGRLQEADAACGRALAIAERRGDQLRRAEALQLRATIALRREELQVAAPLLEEAHALAAQGEDALLQAEVLRELGEVWRQQGAADRARATWTQSLHLLGKVGVEAPMRDLERRLATLAT